MHSSSNWVIWGKNVKRVEGTAGGWERIINTEIEVNKGINSGYWLLGRQNTCKSVCCLQCCFQSPESPERPKIHDPEVTVQKEAHHFRLRFTANCSVIFLQKRLKKSDTSLRWRSERSHSVCYWNNSNIDCPVWCKNIFSLTIFTSLNRKSLSLKFSLGYRNPV